MKHKIHRIYLTCFMFAKKLVLSTRYDLLIQTDLEENKVLCDFIQIEGRAELTSTSKA